MTETDFIAEQLRIYEAECKYAQASIDKDDAALEIERAANDAHRRWIRETAFPAEQAHREKMERTGEALIKMLDQLDDRLREIHTELNNR